jgi:alpha-L-rhamnosidase
MGATTIWERWDSMLPDGSINPGETTSFNHYTLGGVADWMHRVIGGIATAEPGYRRLMVAPVPGRGVSSAAASLHTPYGRASCRWKVEGSAVDVEVEVPPNTSATVTRPGLETDPLEVASGRHHWSYTVGAQVAERWADDPRGGTS